MEIQLKLYGSSKLLSDKETLLIELPANSNVEQLRNSLSKIISEKYSKSNLSNLPISAAFFSNCLGRSIYLFSASNSSAKEIGANHFLIDNYIAKYKKDSLILDFEGSMIPTLARFYASFGAEKKYYFLINKR